MKKGIKFLFAATLLASFNMGHMTVSAADQEEAYEGFSVTPLSPETGEAQSSYYDLLVTPGDKKQLKVKVYNSSAEPIKVKAEMNDASTNDNGLTSYQKVDKRDSSLKVAFSDMITTENETLTVKGNSAAVATFDLTVPNKPFKGSVLGGLRFTSEALGDKKNTKETAVTNKMAYTVAVLLRENDDKHDPKMSLNKVVTEQRNYRNYISANLQNSAPRMIKKLEANAEVYEKGTDKLYYQASKEDMRMAPNSNFLFGISLENQPFKNGDYTMKVTGKADGKPFSFEKDFTIDEKEAEKMNKNAVFVEANPWENIVKYVAMALGFIVLLIIAYILYHRTRKEG